MKCNQKRINISFSVGVSALTPNLMAVQKSSNITRLCFSNNSRSGRQPSEAPRRQRHTNGKPTAYQRTNASGTPTDKHDETGQRAGKQPRNGPGIQPSNAYSREVYNKGLASIVPSCKVQGGRIYANIVTLPQDYP